MNCPVYMILQQTIYSNRGKKKFFQSIFIVREISWNGWTKQAPVLKVNTTNINTGQKSETPYSTAAVIIP